MDNLKRRRNYYIDKEFQGKFILKFCSLILMGSLISGTIIYGMSRATVTTAFVNSKLTIKSTADFMLPAVLLSSAVMILMIGIATIAITLFTSHRIAGPLYRIEKDIDEITSGNLNIVFNLRHGDEIKPIAASLNLMAGSLKEKILAVKQAIIQLESEIDRSPNPASENIKNRIKSAKDAVNKFTV